MASPSQSTTTLTGGENARSWSPFILEEGKEDEEGRAVPRRHRSYTSLIASVPRSAGFFKAAPGQAWRDLRAARWGRFFLWVLFVTWLVVLGVSIAYLIRLGSDRGEVGANMACQSDGTFSMYAYHYSWWNMQAFFHISLARGEFTFTEVKVLDIAVQLIVGRGGQALLAFISWRAFRNYLTAKMVESPVTFATFFVIFVQTEPTLVSTYRLIREFCLHRRSGSIAAGIFIPITVIFLFIFPTFVNTMTGYVASNEPFVEGYDGKMIPFWEFDKVAYIIHDGERIGRTNEYVVPAYAHDALIYDFENNYSECYTDDPPHGCRTLELASLYVEAYGFYGLLDEKTMWDDDVPLKAPALNISGFYSPPGDYVYAYDWEDPRKEGETWDVRRPFHDERKIQFINAAEEMYDFDYMEEYGRCQPTAEVYRWGASFIQLFIMAVVLTLWSLGTSIMWFSGHRCLPLVGEPEVTRGWRGVMQLARAMEAELPAAGVDVDRMTDNGAKREVRKRLRGGAVSYRSHVLSRGEGSLRTATLAWFRRDRWWAVALAVCFVFGLLSYGFLGWGPGEVGFILALISWAFTGLIVAVVALGTTLGSRLLMFSVGAVPIVAIVVGVSLGREWHVHSIGYSG